MDKNLRIKSYAQMLEKNAQDKSGIPCPCRYADLLEVEPTGSCDETPKWIEDLDMKIPIWSCLYPSNCVGHTRDLSFTMKRNYRIEIPKRLYSLWGSTDIHTLVADKMRKFPKYQWVCNVLVCCAALKYNLNEWSTELLDDIIYHGSLIFASLCQRHNVSNAEFSKTHLDGSMEFRDSTYQVDVTEQSNGLIYIPYGYNRYNLARALVDFFRCYQFGLLMCRQRCFAFGFATDVEQGYFMYDCQCIGEPMMKRNVANAYVLRTNHLQILLYCLTVALNVSNDYIKFTIYNVDIRLEDTYKRRPKEALSKNPLTVNKIDMKESYNDMVVDGNDSMYEEEDENLNNENSESGNINEDLPTVVQVLHGIGQEKPNFKEKYLKQKQIKLQAAEIQAAVINKTYKESNGDEITNIKEKTRHPGGMESKTSSIHTLVMNNKNTKSNKAVSSNKLSCNISYQTTKENFVVHEIPNNKEDKNIQIGLEFGKSKIKKNKQSKSVVSSLIPFKHNFNLWYHTSKQNEDTNETANRKKKQEEQKRQQGGLDSFKSQEEDIDKKKKDDNMKIIYKRKVTDNMPSISGKENLPKSSAQPISFRDIIKLRNSRARGVSFDDSRYIENTKADFFTDSFDNLEKSIKALKSITAGEPKPLLKKTDSNATLKPSISSSVGTKSEEHIDYAADDIQINKVPLNTNAKPSASASKRKTLRKPKVLPGKFKTNINSSPKSLSSVNENEFYYNDSIQPSTTYMDLNQKESYDASRSNSFDSDIYLVNNRGYEHNAYEEPMPTTIPIFKHIF